MAFSHAHLLYVAVSLLAPAIYSTTVQGSRLGVNSTSPKCRTDHCGNDGFCRQRACQIPTGTEVNVTCWWTGTCDSHISIHRIDAAGERVIRASSGHLVLPGFQRLEMSSEQCWVKVTLRATTSVVLQCAIIHTNNTSRDRFSMAWVLSVTEDEEYAAVNTIAATSTFDPSPSATVSSTTPGPMISASPEAGISTRVQHSEQPCDCAIPTDITDSSLTDTSHRLFTIATALLPLSLLLQ